MFSEEIALLEKFRFGFYGVLIFLSLFMFIQYLQNQRKPYYIFYALYIFGTLLVFEPHLTPIRNAYRHFLEWPVILVYFLFLDAFLNLSGTVENFRKIFLYYQYLFAGAFAGQTLLIYVKENGWFYETLENLTTNLDDGFFYLSILLAIYILYEVSKLRTVPSRYILFGMFFVTLGVMLNRLFYNSLGVYPIWGGVFMELLLFASAIGYQVWLTEKEKGRAQQGMLKATLSTLQDQMNPHFVSNSLNSIKRLIQEGEKQKAIDYLTGFSKLHRMAVNHLRDQKITLSRELTICRLYLEMEKHRFKDSFDYQIEIEADENLISFVEIPPLLFQPIVENAIWHGLLKKEGQKRLNILIEDQKDVLLCTIEDNGVGRVKKGAEEYEGPHAKSTGIANTREKLKIFQTLYHLPIDMKIIDKKDKDGRRLGTKVQFLITYN